MLHPHRPCRRSPRAAPDWELFYSRISFSSIPTHPQKQHRFLSKTEKSTPFFSSSKPFYSWNNVTYGCTVPWIFWISCNLCRFMVPVSITAWFWLVSLQPMSPTLFMWNKNNYLENKGKMRLYSAFNNPDMVISLEQNLHIQDTSSVCHLFLWAQNWIISSENKADFFRPVFKLVISVNYIYKIQQKSIFFLKNIILWSVFSVSTASDLMFPVSKNKSCKQQVLKLCQWVIGKNSSHKGGSGTETGCPGKWWNHHP